MNTDLLREFGRERLAAVIVVTHDERMIEGFDRIDPNDRRADRARARAGSECQSDNLAVASGATACAATPDGRWSGRPESNRRRPAWEAGILPLNYARI